MVQSWPPPAALGAHKLKRGGRHPVSPHGTRLARPVRLSVTGGPNSARLFGRPVRYRLNRYEDAALDFCTESDPARDQCEKRVVLAQSNIAAGMPLGSALARDNIAGKHLFPAKNLESQPLGLRIASVAGGTACFFVSHRRGSFSAISAILM